MVKSASTAINNTSGLLSTNPTNGNARPVENRKPGKTRHPTFRGSSGCVGKLCFQNVFSALPEFDRKVECLNTVGHSNCAGECRQWILIAEKN